MRRFLLLLITLLSTATFAFAEEVTVAIAGDKFTKDAENEKIATFTSDGFTFTLDQDNSSTASVLTDLDKLRIYQNANFTVSANNGETITQLVIKAISNYAGDNYLGIIDGGGSIAYNNLTFTWTGNTSTISFNANKQTRIKSITITYGTGSVKETLSFDKASVSHTLGDTFNAPTLNHAGGLTINWESSNTAVATVDDSGNVEIKSIGTTIITATDDSDNTNTASYTLKVVAPETNPSYQIVFLSGTSEPNAPGASLANCIESGKEYISSISQTRAFATCANGIKLGSGSGIGTITLTLSETGAVRATKIVVNAVKYNTDATTISVNGATAQDLTSSLEDYTFTLDNSLLSAIKIQSGGSKETESRCYVKSITVYYLDDSTLEFTNTAPIATYGEDFIEPTLVNKSDDKTYKWESDNTDVAEVSSDGKLTIKNIGTAVITVTEQETSKTASYTLTVNASSKVGLAFYAGTFIVLKDATKDFVEPVLINPNGLENITYTSSDDNIAMVGSTGEISIEDGLADGTKVTITASVEAQGNYTAGSASYTIVIKDPSIVVDGPTETLTASDFKATSTTYTSGTSTKNEFSYAFETAKNSNGAIQLRATNPGGIILTANDKGYVLRKVTVEWNSATANGRTLDVYGKNTAYTGNDAGNLYNNSTKGTKLGSIVYGTSTELVIEGDYQFIGLRSNSNALMLTSITLIWEAPAVPEYSSTLTLGNETINDVKANTLSLAKVGDDLGSYNVYLNSTEIGAANNECNYLPYSTNGNFTISDGITAYALTTNQFSYDFTQQVGEVTGVNYIALREDKYLVPGKTDEWYLSAEYTIAPKEPALKDMVVTLSDCVITYEGHGEFSAFNGNKVTVAKVGTFKFVTNKVNDKDVTTAVYTIDEDCMFGVNLNFPFFVYGSLQDMMQKSFGDPTVKAIKSTKQTVVLASEEAQPNDTEGTGNVSGVESVVVDSEGVVEYYNLQGIRVEGALTPGIYIRRTATGTSKVAIR